MSVTLERHGPVAVLTMDDGKANALRPDSMAALDAAFTEALDGGARALVIAGRPGFFSGGLDLKLLPTLPAEEQAEALRQLGRLLLRLYLLPVPTVAALTGHAMAGGALLALACDVRVGADGAFRMAVNEVAIGLPMPSFGIEIVRGSVPRWAQVDVLLHGRTFTLAEARDRCLVEDLYVLERVAETARLRAAKLATIPAVAYSSTKERLRGPGARQALEAVGAEVDQFIDEFRSQIQAR